MQKINRKQYSLTGSVFKLWYVLVAKLKYCYHRLLRRTLQGSVRYSASSLFPFSQGEATVLHYKSKLHIYHILFITLLNIFEDTDNNQCFRKAWAV